MKRETYSQLLPYLCLPFASYPYFEGLQRMFGVSKQTLMSIYSQESQMRVIRTHQYLKQALPELVTRYMAGCDILELSYELDFPPCIVMRRLLEALPLGLGRQRITEVLRNPRTLTPFCHAAWANGGAPPTGVGSHEEALAAAEALLPRLEADVAICVAADHVYSPTCDAMRHESGVRYEEMLYERLHALGAAFWTEQLLRAKGFFKTPDAKLQVPIAVRGRLLHWIDSKATFGDDRLHRQQFAEQYIKYVNRYGPGAVLYWFGYVEDLEEEDDVLLMGEFPEAHEVTLLPQLPLSMAEVSGELVGQAAGALQALRERGVPPRHPGGAAEGSAWNPQT